MQLFENTLGFLDLICSVLRFKPLNVTLGVIVKGRLSTHEAWCGGLPSEESSSDWMSAAKLHELVWLERTKGRCANEELRFSPVEGFKRTCRYLGAVQQGNYLVGVSGWDPELDLLMALIALYDIAHRQINLHHITHVHKTHEEAEKNLGRRYYLKDKSSERWFQKVVDPRCRLTDHYYVEQRFYNKVDVIVPATLLDFWTTEPLKTTSFLHNALNQAKVKHCFWEGVDPSAETQAPSSYLWVRGQSGKIINVSTRRDWWTVY